MALAGMINKIVIRSELVLFRANLSKLILLFKIVSKDEIEGINFLILTSSDYGGFQEFQCIINS